MNEFNFLPPLPPLPLCSSCRAAIGQCIVREGLHRNIPGHVVHGLIRINSSMYETSMRRGEFVYAERGAVRYKDSETGQAVESEEKKQRGRWDGKDCHLDGYEQVAEYGDSVYGLVDNVLATPLQAHK